MTIPLTWRTSAPYLVIVWPRRIAAAAVALTLAACAEQAERPTESTPAEVEVARQSATVENRISWPPASELDREALAALPNDAAAAVDKTPLPVLVVDRAELLAQAKLIAKPKFYALSTSRDGITVSLHATNVAHRYGHIAPASGDRSVRGHSAFVTQNQGIWSVAWVEGGAAYVLEVECASRPDPRCNDDSFVVELAAGLAYVGGRQLGAAASEAQP